MPRPEAFARKGRRARLRPLIEGLEARLLMANAGMLDPTFGGGAGYSLTSIVPLSTIGLSSYTASVVEPDGSILVDGPVGASDSTYGVIHLAANGSPDASFGVAGEADVVLPAGITLPGPPNEFLQQTELLRQPDGKVILVGIAQTAGPNPKPVTIVARFDASGAPDTSFGTAGVVALDQATVGTPGASLPYAVLQADGKLVLAGTSTLATTTQVASVRLTSTGTLDATYGTNGLVTISDATQAELTQRTPAAEVAEGVAIEPNGQIVIAASLANVPVIGHYAIFAELIRLNADGSRDTSLSQAGILASDLSNPGPNGLIIQPDGKFLLLGRSDPLSDEVPVLVRLNADGSFDKQTGWFGVGVSTSSFALEPDGKILMTGALQIVVSQNPLVYGARSFVAFRSTADLDPDPSFGDGGISALNLSQSTTSVGDGKDTLDSQAVSVGANGRAVIVGSDNSYPISEVVIARLTNGKTAGGATPGDYTGDGMSDPTIYLPAYGEFAFVNSSGGPGGIIPFGPAGPGQTIPAPGNYYGTGYDDFAAYLPAYGDYAIKDPTGKTAGIDIPFGIAGLGQTIPAPGDYYSTEQDDIAVYLVQSGVFAIKDPTGKTAGKMVQFGIGGAGQSIPVPGDYYGNGQDDIAVYLAQAGVWAIQDPTGQTSGEFIPFGRPGLGNSIPVPGDYDNSGKTELAVYVPILGVLIYRPANGGADVTIPFGMSGDGNTLPAPGDYDGSGKTEVAAYLPSLGVFAYRSASGGADVSKAIGLAGPGQTIPVTTVVLSPLPGSGAPEAIEAASIMGEPDALDFLPSATAKKRVTQ